MKIKLFLTTLLFYTYTGISATVINDSVSYAMGISIASSLKQNGILDHLDINSLMEAFSDTKSSKAQLTDNEAEQILVKYFTALNEKEKQENLKQGELFLEQNAKAPDVNVLPSGLQYKILQKGHGANPPKSTDTVEVNYKGFLIDGQLFESSYDNGKPIKFLLKQVIPGWTEGLQHITEGGKIVLYIPTQLAYGERVRQGSPIKPNAALIFEIELLKIIAVP
jgi:FKBP-type peptidyl-prolyl cis-trans isomerase FklB